MTKHRRNMSQMEAINLIKNNITGVLSTVSSDGLPYGVPIHYFYVDKDESVYFHCAPSGRKIDNMLQNSHVSLTIISSELIIEEKFTTNYKSVIVEGKAQLISDEEEKIRLLHTMCNVFIPTMKAQHEELIKKYFNSTCIFKIEIDKISGKENSDN